MTTGSFQKIQRMRSNANELATFWDRYKAHIAKPDIDKYAAGFGVDNRCSHFKISTSFDSKSGVYGNSSVSPFGRFDADTVQPYILRAMNDLAPELFERAAELMRKDAAKLVDEARAEVQRMNDALEACLSESGEEEPDQ